MVSVRAKILSVVRRQFRTLAFALVIWSALLYLYRMLPLSDYVEMRLYDLRTQVADTLHSADNSSLPIVLELSPKDFEKRASFWTKDSYFSSEKIAHLASLVLTHGAKEVVILSDNFLFKFEEDYLGPIVALATKHRNITLGILGFSSTSPSSFELPRFLDPIKDQVRGFETIKKRSNSVIRTSASQAYMGQESRMLLPSYLREKLSPGLPAPLTTNYFNERRSGVLLRWHRGAKIEKIHAFQLEEKLSEVPSLLSGKIVVVGYGFLPSFGGSYLYNPLENTPLKGDPNTFTSGETLPNIVANLINNYVHDNYLRPAGAGWVIFQWLFILICFSLAFVSRTTLSVLVASLTFLAVALVPSIFMTSFFRLYLPSGNELVVCSAFFSFLAIWRASKDISTVVKKQVEASYQAKVSSSQSKFLSLFSDEMIRRIAEIKRLIDSFKNNYQLPLQEKSIAEKLDQSLGSFSDMVGTIHQFSKAVESSGKNLPVQIFSLKPSLESLVQQCKSSATAKGISIRCDVPPELKVQASKQMFELIIHNFLSNAIKYSPSQTEVLITSRLTKDSKVVVDVEDQGCGIAPGDLENIFEKFFRVQNPLTIDSKGLGLGLYLVRFFSEKANMRVEVASELGKGSIFTLIVGAKK